MAWDELKWFTKQTDRNKLEIFLVVVIVLLMYAIRLQYTTINTLTDEFKQTDSLYIDRLNNLHTLYQEELKKCNNKRIEEQIEQNKVWLDKYEQLYEETHRTFKTIKQ